MCPEAGSMRTYPCGRVETMVGTRLCFLERSCSRPTTDRGWPLARIILLLLCAPAFSSAQTMSVLTGRVFDESGAVLRGAEVSMRDDATGFTFSVDTGPEGRYSLVAI